jgi:hypothetical protein
MTDLRQRGRLSALASILITTAIVVIAGVYVLLGARDPWDFRTYHAAGTAARMGLNPYSSADLSAVSGHTIELPFLYPPVALSIFVLLSTLPFAIAFGVWTAFKVIMVGFLIWLWRRELLSTTSTRVVIATTLLGFNLCALWDLRTGNVGLIEAAILWLAFAAYLRERFVLAAVFIVIGSVFKVLPILLLAVIAMAPIPKKARLTWITIGLVILLVSVSIPIGLASAWRMSLAVSSEVVRPTGEINPSALGLADVLANAFELPRGTAPGIALAIYLFYCAVVLLASVGPWLRTQRSSSRTEQVMLVVLLWLLLSPRVMIYSYVMAIAPVLYVLETRVRSRAVRLAGLGVVMAQGIVRLLPGPPPAILAPTSFLILFGSWMMLRRRPLLDAVRSSLPTPP